MNFNLLKQSLADRRVSLLIYAASVALYGIMILAIWPSMQASGISEMWDRYPESIKKAFGATINFGEFDGFIALEYFAQMWVIIMAAFAISLATGALAGEIEKGSMELLLSQPISRRSIVITRHFYFSISLLALIAATMLPLMIGAPLVDGELSNMGVAAVSLLAFLFYGAIGSMAFFFSSISSSRGKALFASLGVLIGSYALDLLSKFNDFIDNFHFLSLFYYYDPYRYLHDASIAWGDLAVLAAIIVVSTGAAVTWFERRDIAV